MIRKVEPIETKGHEMTGTERFFAEQKASGAAPSAPVAQQEPKLTGTQEYFLRQKISGFEDNFVKSRTSAMHQSRPLDLGPAWENPSFAVYGKSSGKMKEEADELTKQYEARQKEYEDAVASSKLGELWMSNSYENDPVGAQLARDLEEKRKAAEDVKAQLGNVANTYYDAKNLDKWYELSGKYDVSAIDRIVEDAERYNSVFKAGARELPENYKEIEDELYKRYLPGGERDQKKLEAAMQQAEAAVRSSVGQLGYDSEGLFEWWRRQRSAEKEHDRLTALETQAKDRKFDYTMGRLVSDLMRPVDLARALPTGKGSVTDIESYVPYDQTAFRAGNSVNAISSGVTEGMGKVGKFAYDTGMNILENAIQIATLGPGAGVLMGLSSATSGMQEALARGATNEQAAKVGFLQGVAEMLFEEVSIDKLLQIKDVGTFREVLGTLLPQGGVEASEEIFTEIANIFSDAAIMREKSNFALAVKGYEADGKSPEDAKKLAFLDSSKQVLMAGVGGLVSGLVMSAGKAGISYAQTVSAAGRMTQDEKAQALIEALSYTEEGESVQKKLLDAIEKNREGKLSTAKFLSAVESARLERSMAWHAAQIKTPQSEAEAAFQATVEANPEATVLDPIASRLAELGGLSSDKASEKAAIIAMVKDGVTPSNSQINTLNLLDPVVRRVFTEQTGVEISDADGHKASALRAIVKDTAQRYATIKRQQTDLAEANATIAAATAEQAQSDPIAAVLTENPGITVEQAQQVAAQNSGKPHITFEDGSTASYEQVIADYTARHPGATAEDAEHHYQQMREYNELGKPFFGSANDLTSAPANGMVDTNTNIREDNTNGTEEGVPVSDRTPERGESVDVGVPAATVQPRGVGSDGTDSANSRRGSTAQSRTRGRVSENGRAARQAQSGKGASLISRMSSAELGIENGKTDDVVAVLHPDAYTPEHRAAVELAQSFGVTDVTLVSGRLRYYADGKLQTAKGWTSADRSRIVAQVDNADATALQIVAHEVMHRICSGMGDWKAIAAAVTEMLDTCVDDGLFTREQYGQAYEAYKDKYEDDFAALPPAMREARINEEMLCDIFAGIKAYGVDLTGATEYVKQSIEEYQQYSLGTETGATGEAMAKGSEAFYEMSVVDQLLFNRDAEFASDANPVTLSRNLSREYEKSLGYAYKAFKLEPAQLVFQDYDGKSRNALLTKEDVARRTEKLNKRRNEILAELKEAESDKKQLLGMEKTKIDMELSNLGRHVHGMTAEQIAKIPELLGHPMAVFNHLGEDGHSPCINFLLDEAVLIEDKKGNTVVAPMLVGLTYREKQRQQKSNYFDYTPANVVTTAFGLENVRRFKDAILTGEGLIYADSAEEIKRVFADKAINAFDLNWLTDTYEGTETVDLSKSFYHKALRDMDKRGRYAKDNDRETDTYGRSVTRAMSDYMAGSYARSGLTPDGALQPFYRGARYGLDNPHHAQKGHSFWTDRAAVARTYKFGATSVPGYKTVKTTGIEALGIASTHIRNKLEATLAEANKLPKGSKERTALEEKALALLQQDQQYADDIYRLNRKYDVMPVEVPKDIKDLMVFLRNRRLIPKDLEPVVPGTLYRNPKTDKTISRGDMEAMAKNVIAAISSDEAIYECYLRICAPYIVEADGHDWDDLGDPYGTTSDQIVSAIQNKAGQPYDGIIFKNVRDTLGSGMLPGSELSTVIVVFNDEQVKSTANYAPTNDRRAAFSKDDTVARVHERIGATPDSDYDDAGRLLDANTSSRLRNSVLRTDLDLNKPVMTLFHGNKHIGFKEFNRDLITKRPDWVNTEGVHANGAFYLTDSAAVALTYATGRNPKFDSSMEPDIIRACAEADALERQRKNLAWSLAPDYAEPGKPFPTADELVGLDESFRKVDTEYRKAILKRSALSRQYELSSPLVRNSEDALPYVEPKTKQEAIDFLIGQGNLDSAEDVITIPNEEFWGEEVPGALMSYVQPLKSLAGYLKQTASFTDQQRKEQAPEAQNYVAAVDAYLTAAVSLTRPMPDDAGHQRLRAKYADKVYSRYVELSAAYRALSSANIASDASSMGTVVHALNVTSRSTRGWRAFKAAVDADTESDRVSYYDAKLGRQLYFISDEALVSAAADMFNAAGLETAGAYPVYVNCENPYIVECNGAKWNQLNDPLGTRTREIEVEAERRGYDGVIFRDILDIGSFSPRDLDYEPSMVVCVFKEEQLIPTQGRGSFSKDDGETAPVFYDKLQRVVGDSKQNKMTIDQWIKFAKGRGVKAEELRWSGIELLDPTQTYTKDELMQTLQDGALQIEEVWLGANEAPTEFVDEVTGEVYDSVEQWKDTVIDNYNYDIADTPWSDALRPEELSVNRVNEDTFILSYHDPETGTWEVVSQAEAKFGNETRWDEYSTEDGENYRELLFSLPDSAYKNTAMETHWEDRRGVLAHARIQDFRVNGEKVLFVEEIQSDWHNAGHAEGYKTAEQQAAIRELNRLQTDRLYNGTSDDRQQREDELWQIIDPEDTQGRYVEAERRYDELYANYDDTATATREAWNNLSEDIKYEEVKLRQEQRYANPDAPRDERVRRAEDILAAKDEQYAAYLRLKREAYALRKEYDAFSDGERKAAKDAFQKVSDMVYYDAGAPAAPFANTYTDFVLKRLLREAAEGGYDRLAWTSADMQSDRWDWDQTGRYAEGYRIEYDQDIPKFLSKYGKQWGAQLSTIKIAGWDVQSIPVTEAMRDSVMYEGQSRFAKDDVQTQYPEGSVQSEILRILNSKGTAEERLQRLSDWANNAVQTQGYDPIGVQQVLGNAMQPPVSPEEVASNRAELDKLIERYGALEQGEKAARNDALPVQTGTNEYTRRFVRTALGAKQTPEHTAPYIERMALRDEAATYARISDEAAKRYADRKMNLRGYQTLLNEWEGIASPEHNPTKYDVAMGELLFLEAAKVGDETLAMKILADVAAMGTQAGQTVQAMTLLKKMTPSGKLYYLQKAVDRMNSDLAKRIEKGSANTITIKPALARAVIDAKTKEAVDAAMDALLQDIADQMPVSVMDKWNAWRYLSMLGNPRTHIRNVIGNTVFMPVTFLKDIVASGLEGIFISDPEQRTKNFGQVFATAAAIVPGGGSAYTDFALEDFPLIRDELMRGGKMNPADLIRDKRKVFKVSALNEVSQFNSYMLELEDGWALKPAYVRALSQFLAARNADLTTIRGTKEGKALLNQARAYAMKEAQRATYRDFSAVAAALNRLKRVPVLGLIVDGVLPFTKTPINILKRGIDYSALGLLAGIHNSFAKYRKGNMTASELIDQLSAGLTGTGVMLLGFLLKGLCGGDDEDKKRAAFDKLQGYQNYSITIGKTNITLDWAAPMSLPLFVGMEVRRNLDDGNLTGGELLDALTLIAEPMFSLSMLDGLNTTLKSAGYDENPLTSVLMSTLLGYVGQGVPTLLGQLARTVDTKRRATYVDKNRDTPAFLQRFIQSSIQSKLPGIESQKMAYIDEWGRTDDSGSLVFRALENFISPGYISTIRVTAVDEELARLAGKDGVGDTNVLPRKAGKYFSVNGARKDLTAEEYERYATKRGRLSFDLLAELINSPSYAVMTDEQRAWAVADVYEYADQTAKLSIAPDYKADRWVVNASNDLLSAIALRVQSKANPDGTVVDAVLSMSWLSDTEKGAAIAGTYYADKSFADPHKKGYQFEIDGTEWQAREVELYTAAFTEAYQKLIERRAFQNGDAAKQAELISNLQKELRADTREKLAREMRRSGVKSAKKD